MDVRASPYSLLQLEQPVLSSRVMFEPSPAPEAGGDEVMRKDPALHEVHARAPDEDEYFPTPQGSHNLVFRFQK